MLQKFSELRCKEVINVCDGCRLGFVSDLEVELPMGRVTALIVPGRGKFFGLLGRDHDYCIPWSCVKRVGEDIILVDADLEQCKRRREKRGWFS